MPNFTLVNPYIEGEFDKVYSGKTSIDAAEKVWNKLSGYLTGNIPKFIFTMERDSDKSLHNFVVREKVKNDIVNFSLTEMVKPLDKKLVDTFKEKLNNHKNATMDGGKRKKKSNAKKDDDDEDDDSDSEDYEALYKKVLEKRYKHTPQPITYWWYVPYLYKDVSDSLFLPTFTVPLSPYIHISNLNSTLWHWKP